jgi:glycosyltransferase involved in cell wall biosynthesis
MKQKKITKPLVSVIVPTYNRGYCLQRTIRSVLDQTHPNWELIIVDNYSTDDTDTLVESFKDSRIKILKIHNGGIIAASRNRGLQASVGEYVAFLDSDDWWLPKKLETSLEILDLGADIVYHDLYLITSIVASPRFWKRVRTRQVNSPVFKDLLSKGAAIANSSVVVKRTMIEGIGGFSEDPALIAAEDYEAWLRIARRTEKFSRINKTLGYYWAGGGNVSAPNRTLCYLARLCELYTEELIKNGNQPLPVWISYELAKSNWSLGKHHEGNQHASNIVKNNMLSLFSLKLIIFYFFKLILARNQVRESC